EMAGSLTISWPVRIFVAFGMPALELAHIGKAPEVHNLIQRADRAAEHAERPAQIFELNRHCETVEDLDELSHLAQTDGVGTQVDNGVLGHRTISPPVLLAPHERTIPLFERPECLVRAQGRDQPVDVASRLALARLLDFKEIGRMDLAPVGANASLTETIVVGRHLLHQLDHLAPIAFG